MLLPPEQALGTKYKVGTLPKTLALPCISITPEFTEIAETVFEVKPVKSAAFAAIVIPAIVAELGLVAKRLLI